MIENDISLEENPTDLLKILFKNSVLDELNEKNYKINYFGENSNEYLESLIEYFNSDKNMQIIKNTSINHSDERNYIIYIKYKNIYIGGISILDFKSREGFGLNKYINDKEQTFYLGQWKKNKKWGIGFLKLDKDHLYFGNFIENQMYGDGLYFNKYNENIFFGLFNVDEIKQGFYYNLNKNIYYIGKFVNSKKSDDFSIYINYEYKRILIGEIKNDIFIKGYIGFLIIKETDKEFFIEIEKIIYYNRNSTDDSQKIILKKSDEQFETFMYGLLQAIENIKNYLEQMNLFDELEETYNDSSYNNGIGRYNSYENEYSFENDFKDNYNYFYENLKENVDSIIEEIKNNYKE